MSIGRLFSAFAPGRKYTLWHRDSDGAVKLETRQDCEPIIEFCRAAKGKPADPVFRHVGEIPMSVVGQWMRDGCLDDEAHVRRWLNDPANRDFRVWEGRL